MPAPLEPDYRPHYHELHRVGRPGWWRSLLGAVVLVVLVFGVVPAVAIGGVNLTNASELGGTDGAGICVVSTVTAAPGSGRCRPSLDLG